MSNNIEYTTNFMLGALSNKLKIKESLYYKGFNNIDLLIDLDLLINQSNFTKRQLEVLTLYFIHQNTQEEVSAILGISQQAVLDHIKKIKIKIQKTLDEWGEKDGIQ
ncbi:sigma factor-like helix-turn-helix DNA-binding protein [uncultured Clostridium sp.]|jgi:DNA-directed RNA polymerase specialized sigma subunit|uniref:sigma factor-like helix-turn-helix DNA-binding protein n=1 Tax=uncultured Clostridium sp. TaxID=59620 RepID=UPI00260739AB|nr:sigma factor-like helix-turn-helix DNA-binding protein [uncultured Clostridium sp.]